MNVAVALVERAGRPAADAGVGRQAQLGVARPHASARSRSSPRHRWGRAPPRQPVPPPRPDLRWLPRTIRRGSGAMANETVIKGGTVFDGTGAAGVRADVAITDGRDHRDRHEPRRRSRARRRRLRRRARLHRHPHALRRAGVLGPRAHAVVLPRRHHRRRRQLRLLDRADARPSTASSSPARSRTSRTWTSTRSRPASRGTSRRFPEYLASVERPRRRHQLRRVHRPHRAAPLRDGRRRPTSAPPPRRRSPRCSAVLREAMDAGAAGFATSFASPHRGVDGKPVPSRFADRAELEALLETMGEVGRGRRVDRAGRAVSASPTCTTCS